MKKALLLVLAGVMAVSLCACGLIREKIAGAVRSAVAEISFEPLETDEPVYDTEEPAATQLPQVTAAAEQTAEPVQTVSSGVAGGWPEKIPAWVPEFRYGKYMDYGSGSLEFEGSLVITLVFSEVTAAQVDEYCDELKQAGMDVTRSEANGDLFISGVKKQDNTESSVIIGYKEEEKTVSLVYSFQTK